MVPRHLGSEHLIMHLSAHSSEIATHFPAISQAVRQATEISSWHIRQVHVFASIFSHVCSVLSIVILKCRALAYSDAFRGKLGNGSFCALCGFLHRQHELSYHPITKSRPRSCSVLCRATRCQPDSLRGSRRTQGQHTSHPRVSTVQRQPCKYPCADARGLDRDCTLSFNMQSFTDS